MLGLNKILDEYKELIQDFSKDMKELVVLLRENNDLQRQILTEMKKPRPKPYFG